MFFNRRSRSRISQFRLFCLVAKGDIDFQIDPKSSEALWTEVARLAGDLGDGIWENRARAELGTIAFYKGEIYRAARLVVDCVFTWRK